MRRVDSRGPREEQKKDSREKLRRDVGESGHTCPRGIFLSPLVVVRMEGKKKNPPHDEVGQDQKSTWVCMWTHAQPEVSA